MTNDKTKPADSLEEALLSGGKVVFRFRRADKHNNLAIVTYFLGEEEYSGEMDLSYLQSCGVVTSRESEFEMGKSKKVDGTVYIKPLPERVLTEEEIKEIDDEIDALMRDLGPEGLS